jgi:hypothetical protein
MDESYGACLSRNGGKFHVYLVWSYLYHKSVLVSTKNVIWIEICLIVIKHRRGGFPRMRE